MTKEEVLAKVRFYAELRGLREYTIKSYYSKVKLYQNHFDKPATELDISHIQSYLHYLRTEKKHATGSINICNCSLRFLYNVVLDKPLNLHKIPRIRKQHSFPDILTRDEISKIFSVCNKVRDKCILMTTYSAGLRVGEVTNLKVSDIDSNNMQILIRNGKGGKDRYAILSETNLEILREYWYACRPAEWLFSGKIRPGKPMGTKSIQNIFHKYLKLAGISKKVTTHSLRHAFATHLLEDGVSIYHIKQLLGHADISTTCRYLRITKISDLNVISPIDKMFGGDDNA